MNTSNTNDYNLSKRAKENRKNEDSTKYIEKRIEKSPIKNDAKIRFVNPYNFIPLKKQCIRKPIKVEDRDSYTGYFDCGLQLLTHLFIPNTSSSKILTKKEDCVEGFKGYDFFSYENLSDAEPYEGKPPSPPSEPVIPGSEIRGAVRSVYEAAFNGCMSTIDGGRIISRRSPEVKKVGILEKDSKNGIWKLTPCCKARLLVEQKEKGKPDKKCSGKLVRDAEYKSWNEGQEIWVKINQRNVVCDYTVLDNPSKSRTKAESELIARKFKKGYLHKGEDIKRKNYESVFYGRSDRESFNVPKAEVELLEAVISEYQNEKKNQKAKGQGWYKEYKVSDKGTLVYYSKTKGGHVHLSPACIGKEIFMKKIESLVKNNGNYLPCNGEELCPACMIFGMMEKAEKPQTFAYGSKVRITDAKLADTDISIQELFEEPIVLPEMGEPHPSAVEFYTYSPYRLPHNNETNMGKGYWTYDYKYDVRWKKTTYDRRDLDVNLPKIRGRKYYWHHDVKIQDYKKNNNQELNAMKQRIRPMKPSTNLSSKPLFQFRVYFERLSKIQLNQLKWALDFNNPDCAHKIGRAKPLGFGSVQIIVKGLHLRKIDEKTGRWYIEDIGGSGNISFKEFFKDSGFSEDTIPNALKVMSNWKNRPENVVYPKAVANESNLLEKENAEASHQWFLKNKGEDAFHPNFERLLPEAEEDARKDLEPEKALYELIKK